MAPGRTRTYYPSCPLQNCHENATSTLNFRGMWFWFLITQIIHNCYYINWKLKKKKLKRKGKILWKCFRFCVIPLSFKDRCWSTLCRPSSGCLPVPGRHLHGLSCWKGRTLFEQRHSFVCRPSIPHFSRILCLNLSFLAAIVDNAYYEHFCFVDKALYRSCFFSEKRIVQCVISEPKVWRSSSYFPRILSLSCHHLLTVQQNL